jgi:anaerobic magnesium-protoporphyrin IX monomethyl ester cyclase
MRITLINPSQGTKYPQPPIGLALLAAVMEKRKHDVQILDKNINNPEKFPFEQSDLFGITAMTTTWNEANRIIHDLRRFTAKKVIGGVHATILGGKENTEADFIVKGEGEYFAERINHLEDAPKIAKCAVYSNLDTLPYPAYYLLPMDKYKPHPPHGMYTPWLPMVTSRGCPYKCAFCSKGVFGNTYRHMSPARIVSEIEYYQYRYNVKEICFYDDVFTLKRKHTEDLMELMVAKKLGVKWSCETRVNLVDKSLLKLMQGAGCISISYGIESGSQRILDTIHKGVTVEKNEQAIKMTHDAGIKTVGYMMIGSPGETVEDIEKTIQFAKDMPLDYAQFAIATPLPGSELFEIWRKTHGDISWDKYKYEGGSDSPIFDDVISRKQLEAYKSRAYKLFYVNSKYILQSLDGLKSYADFVMLFKGLRMFLLR